MTRPPIASAVNEVREQDLSQKLTEQVISAFEQGQPLAIQGSGSKQFMGFPVQGKTLSLTEHQGIINYQPSELTITVRSGTPLKVVNDILAEQKQMLAFEPPGFSNQATLGGTIACGLSGPARPFYGAARDFVLGCHIINGKGERLKFGGEVMKNVAGYDLSRLMTGAQGTLGVLLDVSLKVLPLPATEISLKLHLPAITMLQTVRDWMITGHPVSAVCHYEGFCYLRLSGSGGSVKSARQQIGGEEVDNHFWTQLKEQTLSFFNTELPLWRISLPMASDEFEQQCHFARHASQIIDWAGAQRWIITQQPAAEIFQQSSEFGGHAQWYYSANRQPASISKAQAIHQPLQPGLLNLHQRLKNAMDPKHILNPGRIYRDL